MLSFESHHEIKSDFLKMAAIGYEKLTTRRELGFWQLAERDSIWTSSESFARKLLKKSSLLYVIGMGGSSLGGRCLVQCLSFGAQVEFINNLDPDSIQKLFANDKIFKKAHFLIISKTGSTLEVACLLDVILQNLKKRKRKVSDAISVISEDNLNPLTKWAKENNIQFLEHPSDVGGRFSAFTPVGLVPARFAGVALKELRQGLREAVSESETVKKMAAYYLQSFSQKEYQSLFWSYVDQLNPFSYWLIQKWAESLPKIKTRNGVDGPQVSTPIYYEGAKDQHSVLQQLMAGKEKLSVCFITQNKFRNSKFKLTGMPLVEFSYLKKMTLQDVYKIQSYATKKALEEVGRNTAELHFETLNSKTLAQIMMTIDLVIGTIGECLNINAFDQPGVELGKKITIEKLKSHTGI